MNRLELIMRNREIDEWVILAAHLDIRLQRVHKLGNRLVRRGNERRLTGVRRRKVDISRPPFAYDLTFVSNVFEEQLVERLEEFERYRLTLFDRVESLLKGAFGIQDLLQVPAHIDG